MSVQLSGSVPNRSAIKEELDARFRASLLAYFLRRTGNAQEAEDLTQETFVRLIGSHSFEDGGGSPGLRLPRRQQSSARPGPVPARMRRFPPLPLIPRRPKNLNPGWWRI